jgi:hypothetical protein
MIGKPQPHYGIVKNPEKSQALMFQRIGDRKKPGLVTIFERHWIVIRKNKGSVSQRLLFF